jgi:hypothetical protein
MSFAFNQHYNSKKSLALLQKIVIETRVRGYKRGLVETTKFFIAMG